MERSFGDGVQCVEQGQVERARAGRRVAKRLENGSRADRYRHVSFVGRPTQVQDAVRTDEKGGVGPLARIDARVIDDSLAGDRRRLQLVVEQVAEAVQHGDVERSEVGVVVGVDEFVVGAEEVVSRILVRGARGHGGEVQPIFDDFGFVCSLDRQTHSPHYELMAIYSISRRPTPRTNQLISLKAPRIFVVRLCPSGRQITSRYFCRLFCISRYREITDCGVKGL